jgi:carbon monoxide dehydrogenase subunit G
MWYMNPVRVSIDVPQPREQVYDFLDVMANHEPFTNHMLQDWRYSGPDRGVGSKARVTVNMAGRSETVDIEVIAGKRPQSIVEQNVGAGGRRIATGTYTLEALPGGGTRITFEYACKQAPLSERLAAPIVRSILGRGNRRAMERLAEQLRDGSGEPEDRAVGSPAANV